jgi:hypothetical protein
LALIESRTTSPSVQPNDQLQFQVSPSFVGVFATSSADSLNRNVCRTFFMICERQLARAISLAFAVARATVGRNSPTTLIAATAAACVSPYRSRVSETSGWIVEWGSEPAGKLCQPTQPAPQRHGVDLKPSYLKRPGATARHALVDSTNRTNEEERFRTQGRAVLRARCFDSN